jgi:hypothetical protein
MAGRRFPETVKSRNGRLTKPCATSRIQSQEFNHSLFWTADHMIHDGAVALAGGHWKALGRSVGWLVPVPLCACSRFRLSLPVSLPLSLSLSLTRFLLTVVIQFVLLSLSLCRSLSACLAFFRSHLFSGSVSFVCCRHWPRSKFYPTDVFSVLRSACLFSWTN